MDKSTSADEQPKRRVAQRVITSKRRYFFPEAGVMIEASDLASAEKQLKNQTKEGDREK